ncbi:MAG: DNA primase [Fibrobacter sp.]|jgi:DNA primase|nr:DNA primase [Fibrobacter sp.]
MAIRFDESIKEEIRSRADIVAVVSRYVNLKPSGQTMKGLCPFHKEKTPSFHVNPSRGYFHCFGCGKGGDVFTFLQEIEGLDFPEALKMLAQETGVELRQYQTPSQSSVNSAIQLSRTEMLLIHEIAARFFYNNIRLNPKAVEYFKSRMLKAETVRDFNLGYAQSGWSSLVNHCRSKGISESKLVSCGLALQKDGGGVYDRFRDRIMFSLCDLSGKVIGFAGRGMETNAVPKYLNSPETALYKKKEFLFGLHKSRLAIKENGYCMIVEGYMDYLILYQAGIRNVVAVSGTALTPEHGHLLQRFTSNVLLLFDGDSAGQTAAIRAVFVLAPFNLDISILVLPNDEDPDSYVSKYGGEKFLEIVKGARNWVDFIIDKMMQEHDASTPRGKSAVISALEPLVQSINDSIVRQNFKKELSERLNIDEKLVYSRFIKGAKKNSTEGRSGILSSDEEYLTSLEGSFLRILFTKPELINEASQYVAPETLTDGVSGDIYSLVLEAKKQGGSLAGLGDRTADPEVKRLVSLLLVKPALQDHIHEEMVQKIIHLRAKFLRAQIRNVKLQMKDEPQRRTELLAQLQDYSKQLKDLDGG